MDFNPAIITTEGQQLIAEGLAGDTLTFTRLVTSSTVGHIGEVNQDVEVEGITIKDDTSVIIKVQLTNENLSEEYYIETIGIHARNSTGEYLFATATANIAPHMPIFNEQTPTSLFIRMTLGVQQSEIVNVVIDPAGLVNLQDLSDLSETLTIQLNDIRDRLDLIESRYLWAAEVIEIEE